MTMIPILSKIPNLTKELSKALPNYTFHEVKNADMPLVQYFRETDENFQNSTILICDFDLLAPYLYKLPKAEWVQGTWAGLDAILPLLQRKPVNYQISRYSGEHFGHIMGEYVVGNIVNIERNFWTIRDNQKKHVWHTNGPISNYRTIFDLTVGILGMGNIGSRIGKLLHFMGAKVMGFGKRAELDPNLNFLTYYCSKAENLGHLLKSCDYLINVLPNTPETKGLLNGNTLENCKEKESIFINIGRGTIISETNLIRAINKNWIKYAILDVFEDEPLPPNSPLWDMSQVIITPHIAGISRAKDIAIQFKENLKLYETKSPIPTKIDSFKGY